MSTTTIDDIRPEAVMSPEELERWTALPADEQLARLRTAIELGVDSGRSDLDMDKIWSRIRTRHPDAEL